MRSPQFAEFYRDHGDDPVSAGRLSQRNAAIARADMAPREHYIAGIEADLLRYCTDLFHARRYLRWSGSRGGAQ